MQIGYRTMVLVSARLPALCASACASSMSRVVVVTTPAERLTCKSKPAVPTEINDGSTADYIIALADAGQDCRLAVSWSAEWTARVGKR